MRTLFMGTALIAGMLSLLAQTAAAQDKAAKVMGDMDADGDGRISAEEWQRKPKRFKRLDTDGDGFLTMAELRARFGGGNAAPAAGAVDGRISPEEIGPETLCAIGRPRRCDIRIAVKRGLFETGQVPRFPDGLDCRGIDEAWAIDYSRKRTRQNYHGGIDMPAPFGTPMLAVADGVVVGVYKGEKSYRGIEINLRHSPDDTGLPMWVWTQYAHLDKLPDLKPGDRVVRGQNLGPTGNSGISPGKSGRGDGYRRPAIHFAAWFSDSPKFAETRDKVIPLNGQWMDPLALWRGKPPFNSAALRALPEDAKIVPIAVVTPDGATVPAGARMTWPYACTPD
ncbi:MAG: peptidoglycan DD-metalloendopeptidase family protein [Alphaproteobacteria bacterium]